MTEEKSVEQITSDIMRKIQVMIVNDMPIPSCVLKKAKRQWKYEQVITKLIEQLNDKKGAR